MPYHGVEDGCSEGRTPEPQTEADAPQIVFDCSSWLWYCVYIINRNSKETYHAGNYIQAR